MFDPVIGFCTRIRFSSVFFIGGGIASDRSAIGVFPLPMRVEFGIAVQLKLVGFGFVVA